MILKPFLGKGKFKLKEIDPSDTAGSQEQEARTRFQQLSEEITDLHDLLYAAQKTALLVVFQGMDTSGKDGVIRHVIGAMNPQSCLVQSFKVPTPTELAHDFLWRIHANAPGRGYVSVFNRSHYEDVLVVRVKNLAPEKVWKSRYQRINEFERLLVDANTIVLKFFLHISKDEQERRLLDREKEVEKAWKLSAEDWKNREFWDAYQEAYQDAIQHCATPDTPWYVVPANHKWFRNLAVADVIVETLRPYKEEWLKQLESVGEEELKALHAMRQAH